MAFQNRKQTILGVLQERGSADVAELAALLSTSEITVRRDLGLLAADGLLYRTHGGAMRVDLIKNPVDFANKSARNAEEKDHICRLAAQEIQEGETILLDCGSTVFRLCPFIRNKSIRVVTNSLPIVYELINSAVTLNLVGGEVDAGRQAVHGEMAREHIARYRADRAFIGVDGLSRANGLSAGSEAEAGIALALAKQAAHVYLLCDASKLERDSYLQFAPLTLINTLITDARANESLLSSYREVVRVLV